MQSFSASKGDGIADLERQLVLWMKPATTPEEPIEEADEAAIDDVNEPITNDSTSTNEWALVLIKAADKKNPEDRGERRSG